MYVHFLEVRLFVWVCECLPLIDRTRHANESWHTCEWVMAHIWMNPSRRTKESRNTSPFMESLLFVWVYATFKQKTVIKKQKTALFKGGLLCCFLFTEDSFGLVPWLIHMLFSVYCFLFSTVNRKQKKAKRKQHMNESRHQSKWVLVDIRTSHGTLPNESRHTYAFSLPLANKKQPDLARHEWVMAHMNESRTHGWARAHINKTWHVFEWICH